MGSRTEHDIELGFQIALAAPQCIFWQSGPWLRRYDTDSTERRACEVGRWVVAGRGLIIWSGRSHWGGFDTTMYVCRYIMVEVELFEGGGRYLSVA